MHYHSHSRSHSRRHSHDCNCCITTYLRPGLHTPDALAALVVAFLPCRRPLVLIAGGARAAVLIPAVDLAPLHGRVAAVAARLVAESPLALGPVRTGLVAAALERVGHVQPLATALRILDDVDDAAIGGI